MTKQNISTNEQSNVNDNSKKITPRQSGVSNSTRKSSVTGKNHQQASEHWLINSLAF